MSTGRARTARKGDAEANADQPGTLAHAMPFLAWIVAIATIAALFHLTWIVVLGIALFVYILYFFRTPSPRLPADPLAIVSPAHGVVTDIADCEENSFLKGPCRRIGIFLSVFDVHVQLAPTDASIRWTDYRPGRFLDARDERASLENESQWVGFESGDGFKYTVRMIAGLIARRIVLWQPEGKALRRGDRISLIRFGSRVELYLPRKVAVQVKVGDRVKGGETIVGKKP